MIEALRQRINCLETQWDMDEGPGTYLAVPLFGDALRETLALADDEPNNPLAVKIVNAIDAATAS